MEQKPTKDTRMIAQERRHHMFEEIETTGIVSVRELVQRFGVSTITIMRDLQELEQEGLIRRVHGGAVSVRGASYEPPFIARESHYLAEKQRIAARAVELIHDGDSLILDVGTTTLEIARALKGKRNLTVLLTSLRAALELSNQSAIQVIMLGGKLRSSELSLVGHMTENTLRMFQVDKAFIGIGGITIEHGLTEFNFEEAGTKRVMIERARERIVVADHTKFGKAMLNTVASLSIVDTIITGAEVDGEMVTRLQQLGVEVVLA
jgi:DeoR/GlpR family transcriptional regulator of sugar metabolism